LHKKIKLSANVSRAGSPRRTPATARRAMSHRKIRRNSMANLASAVAKLRQMMCERVQKLSNSRTEEIPRAPPNGKISGTEVGQPNEYFCLSLRLFFLIER